MDEQLLDWYNVPTEQGRCLCDMLRSLHNYSNMYIQSGFNAMVLSMRNAIHEKSIMADDMRILKESLNQSETLCKTLQEANDKLNAKISTVASLEVNHRIIYFSGM